MKENTQEILNKKKGQGIRDPPSNSLCFLFYYYYLS
jgi:hypothetical protein